ncbi:MAG: hypothetical protein HYV63_17470 [Candidatus Schekmanbacteria bacterium]|nr:hypothetical protein [Candidatus Schekmanbacteria bacterium]
MDFVQIHLILNHLPPIGALFALIAVIAGALRNEDAVLRLGLVVGTAALSLIVPVYLTGERAEEVAERLPGVTEELIHEHEEAAEAALAVALVAAAVSGGGLVAWRLSPRLKRAAVSATVVLYLAALGAATNAGRLGGEIRHSELRGSPPAASALSEHEQ